MNLETESQREIAGGAPGMNRTWLKRHLGKLLSLAILFLAVYGIFVAATNGAGLLLPTVYSAACAAAIFTVVITRRDVLSPACIGSCIYIITFLVPVPFFLVTGEIQVEYLSPQELTTSIIVSFAAYCCYLLGCRLSILTRGAVGKVIHTHAPFRPVTQGQFLFILAWSLGGSFLRLWTGVGFAGMQSPFQVGQLAGVIEYTFENGTLFLIAIFAYRAISRELIYLFEVYVLAGILTVTQLIQGWKGAILGVLIMLFSVIWYQRQHPGVKDRSLFWALILLVLIPVTMALGNQLRTQRIYNQTQEYSESGMEFTIKLIMRLDGNNRLTKVINHETAGGDLSATNGFKIVTLMKDGASARQYADANVHLIDPNQAHSVGASGPGGAYIGMGLAGVVLGYIFIGSLYGGVYVAMRRAVEPSIGLALYIIMIDDLLRLYMGNFDIVRLGKEYVFVFVILFVTKKMLRPKFDQPYY